VTEREVVAQVEAELERLTVADVLLHTASTVATLAYRKLTPSDRDLDQVRLAIDALAAVLPLLEHELPAELEQDFRQALANLRFAYAESVGPLQ
jgi:hypothetical protein